MSIIDGSAGENWVEILTTPFNGIAKLIIGYPKAIGFVGQSLPGVDSVGFTINRFGTLFTVEAGESLYIRAYTGSVSVTLTSSQQSSEGIDGPLQKTAFGDLSIDSISPITQVKGQNGLLPNVLTVTDSGASGINSVIDDKFSCQTGTASDGLATIVTSRQISTRPGQGMITRFSAIFDAPVTGNRQGAGLITAENLYVFGYLDTTFGIIGSRDGKAELQELTLTSASGSETASITIGGNLYSVPLTGFGTVEQDAYEIASILSVNVPNYNFSSNGDVVVAQSVLAEPQGSFSYSSGGTSAGSWVQMIVGTDGILSFIPQVDWNFDNRMSGDSNRILNKQMSNSYSIQINGGVDFYIDDKDSKRRVLVHRIKLVNTDTLSSVGESVFRVGWISRNLGNTTNITVQGGYASAFVEGDIYYDTPARGISVNQTVVAASGQNSILIFRNRISFSGKVNRSEILPLLVSAASQTSKFAFFKLLLNPTFSEPIVFEYVEKETSVMEVSKQNVIVTGGQELGAVTVESGAPSSVSFNSTMSRTTALFPGSIFALVAEIPSSGGTGDCQGGLTWQEDL